MKNIVLIGMPGAGKSTVGVILAKTLGMRFIDTDLIIQESEGRLLQQILDTDGVARFREIEERCILSLAAANAVIATGGSVVYSDAAMRHLKEAGTAVYLRLDYPEIERRIRNIRTRGVLLRPGQSLYDLYRERQPLYERHADVTVDCGGKTAEEVVETIRALLL